jgi:hypothetical protein
MTDNVSVSGPVTVTNDSHSRVAYDLMIHISNYESPSESERHSRDYWLKLYSQCYQASKGRAVMSVLEMPR